MFGEKNVHFPIDMRRVTKSCVPGQADIAKTPVYENHTENKVKDISKKGFQSDEARVLLITNSRSMGFEAPK